MLHREVAPHPKLRRLIKCFWMLDHDYANSFQDHEQLWADAHTELIFSTGQRYFQRVRSHIVWTPANFVIGPFQHDLQLYSRGRTTFVAARFLPWGFHALSKIPDAGAEKHRLELRRDPGAGDGIAGREACCHRQPGRPRRL